MLQETGITADEIRQILGDKRLKVMILEELPKQNDISTYDTIYIIKTIKKMDIDGETKEIEYYQLYIYVLPDYAPIMIKEYRIDDIN